MMARDKQIEIYIESISKGISHLTCTADENGYHRQSKVCPLHEAGLSIGMDSRHTKIMQMLQKVDNFIWDCVWADTGVKKGEWPRLERKDEGKVEG